MYCSKSTHTLQIIPLPLRGKDLLTEYFSATGSSLGHSAILQYSAPLQRNTLFLLKWWHFHLTHILPEAETLAFPYLQFQLWPRKQSHQTKHSETHVLSELTNGFILPFTALDKKHPQGWWQNIHRQSSGTMSCAMSRKSSLTTENSNAKCLLTYLHCYPAPEKAANVHCTKLTIKDHITDYFPIITNPDSFTFSALPCRSTKCQQYPWTHLKGTQHLWKKTKPDKMLPN